MKTGSSLSVCLIAKNEEQFLERCLASLGGLADEIIFVDTGSSDATLEIAQRFGAKIFQVEWPNDFSAARNISLSHASGDWILVIDADESLAEESRHELISALSGPRDCYYIKRRHYFPISGAARLAGGLRRTSYGDEYGSEHWTQDLRLFPNDARIKFHGRIHEGIEKSAWGAGIACKESAVVLDHFGPLKTERERIEKSAHYLSLSRQKWEEERGSWKAGAEYADSLLQADRAQEALAVLQSFSEAPPNQPEYWFFLGRAQASAGKLSEAVESLSRSIELGPGYYPAYLTIGAVLRELGQLDSAAVCLREGIRLMPGDPSALIELALTHLSRHDFAAARQSVQDCLSLVPGFPLAESVRREIDQLESSIKRHD